MTIVAVVDWLLTLALLPFIALLASITAAALYAAHRNTAAPARRDDGAKRWRFAIVIPAHNEEENVAATVAACRALAYPVTDFLIHVIADNCTDSTARVARAAGATVFERFDEGRRGKAYGLEDYFRAHVPNDGAGPIDAYVVIDADTVPAADLLERFAEALDAGAEWVQGYHAVRNPYASWRTQLMSYAFALFNGIWPLGLDRLGVSAGLRGNGMCFAAGALARFPWWSHGLAEDFEFGWRLFLAGERVRFCAAARVFSEMARRSSAAVSQRQRWEAGRKELPAKFRVPLIRSANLSSFTKLLGLIELHMPPLTTLVALLAAACIIHPAALAYPALRPTAHLLWPLHLTFVLAVAAYAISPFLCLGLSVRTALALPAVPYYIVWRAIVIARRKPTAWLRTARDTLPSTGTAPTRP